MLLFQKGLAGNWKLNQLILQIELVTLQMLGKTYFVLLDASCKVCTQQE